MSDLLKMIHILGLPHVDMEGLGLVDLEPSRPGAVGRVHEADAQQLVVVVPGPVEDHAGTRQGGDVALRVGWALAGTRVQQELHTKSQFKSEFVSYSVMPPVSPFPWQTLSVRRLVCA